MQLILWTRGRHKWYSVILTEAGLSLFAAWRERAVCCRRLAPEICLSQQIVSWVCLRIYMWECMYVCACVGYSIRPQSRKTQTIKDITIPVTIYDRQSFLGLTNYHRKIVERYFQIIGLLLKLHPSRQGSPNKGDKSPPPQVWNDDAKIAFCTIQEQNPKLCNTKLPWFHKTLHPY